MTARNVRVAVPRRRARSLAPILVAVALAVGPALAARANDPTARTAPDAGPVARERPAPARPAEPFRRAAPALPPSSDGSLSSPPPIAEDPGDLAGGPPAWSSDPLGGRYSTERLVAAAELLRAAGWSPERIRRRVYPPFIVVGPASWSDSWGAPRYGPGPIVRRHEGQDVLCGFGADVLAPEAGTIEFDTGLLGGRVARLFRPQGGYWYFAHLSAWNLRDFSSGDRVRIGDVIGSCGATGNATVPHVHFGWYGPDGVARDPMRTLVSWLRTAEGRITQVLRTASIAPPEPADVPDGLARIFPAAGTHEGSRPGPRRPSATTADRRPRAPTADAAIELTSIWVAAIVCRSAGRRGSRRWRERGRRRAAAGVHDEHVIYPASSTRSKVALSG